jgi:hypothetical protein
MQGYQVTSVDIQSKKHKEVFTNYFVLRISLNPGSNEILLRALNAQNQPLNEMPFSYIYRSDIDKKTEVPTSFDYALFHIPENEAECTQCHRLQLTGAERSNRSAILSPKSGRSRCQVRATDKIGN